VGVVVLNAGRSPCVGGVDGVDSSFEDCFVRASWAAVHPASKATEATAATAKVIEPFTEKLLSLGTPAAVGVRPLAQAVPLSDDELAPLG
jgi:hypothetical protein